MSLPLLQDKNKYLDAIHGYMEVHGTVHGTSTVHLPSYVKNHGILSGRDLQILLRETKVRTKTNRTYRAAEKATEQRPRRYPGLFSLVRALPVGVASLRPRWVSLARGH